MWEIKFAFQNLMLVEVEGPRMNGRYGKIGISSGSPAGSCELGGEHSPKVKASHFIKGSTC